MRKEIKNLYRAIAGLSNEGDGCECSLPGGGTNCCDDYGACCTKRVNVPGGPITLPGPWSCKNGVRSEECKDDPRAGIRRKHKGFGSKCGLSTDGSDGCNATAGESGMWACCHPDPKQKGCLITAKFDLNSQFKCDCKKLGGICKESTGMSCCEACGESMDQYKNKDLCIA
jgi:hypothetical protein